MSQIHLIHLRINKNTNESNHTPVHETESSFEPQRKYEALQASNNYDNCQDTLLTIKNEILPAAWSFDQLGISNGGVFQNLAPQEVDETKFIRKGKQSWPPDVNSSLKPYQKE